MKGQVLNYSVQDNAGIISGDDGRRYTFEGPQWQEQDPPVPGARVDFQTAEGTDEAMSIYLEGIIYLTKGDAAFQEQYVKGRKAWF